MVALCPHSCPANLDSPTLPTSGPCQKLNITYSFFSQSMVSVHLKHLLKFVSPESSSSAPGDAAETRCSIKYSLHVWVWGSRPWSQPLPASPACYPNTPHHTLQPHPRAHNPCSPALSLASLSVHMQTCTHSHLSFPAPSASLLLRKVPLRDSLSPPRSNILKP